MLRYHLTTPLHVVCCMPPVCSAKSPPRCMLSALKRSLGVPTEAAHAGRCASVSGAEARRGMWNAARSLATTRALRLDAGRGSPEAPSGGVGATLPGQRSASPAGNVREAIDASPGVAAATHTEGPVQSQRCACPTPKGAAQRPQKESPKRSSVRKAKQLTQRQARKRFARHRSPHFSVPLASFVRLA